MTRRLLPALLFVFACTFAAAQDKAIGGQNQSGTKVLNPFPGGVGSYWIYTGLVQQAPGVDYAKAEEKNVRWRMTLHRILRRDGATAVIVEGFPDDLDWSDDPKPKESMFVVTDNGGLYRFNGEVKDSEQKFTDTHITTKQLLEDGDPWFQSPPVVGAQPGGGYCPDRTDNLYCWVLDEPVRKISVRGIKGIPSGPRASYSLAYRTLPDDSEIDIVAGVGVTGYAYHHHGTIADIDLHLVEAHLVGEK